MLRVVPVAATVQDLAIVNGMATVIVGPAPAQGGGIFNVGDLTLSGVSIHDNSAIKSSAENLVAEGGGVANEGALRIIDSEIRDNTSTTAPAPNGIASGGGVASADGSVEITGTTIARNQAMVVGGIAAGGGIKVSTDGEPARLTVTGSTVSANTTAVETSGGIVEGGGISVRGEIAVVTSTITGNRAVGGGISEGAGILFRGPYDFLLDRSTVNGNEGTSEAIASGAGLMLRHEADDVSIRIVNSTIAENTNSARASSGGAGVTSTGPAAAAIVNSTLAANSASVTEESGSATGNLEAIGTSGGTVVLTASIVADGSGTPGVANCSGKAIASGGHNVESSDECGLRGAGDRVNANPLLGALGDNGGPTQTMALAATSPAVDAGGPGCPATDQRGVARPAGACDSGAFELVLPPPPPPPPPVNPRLTLAKKARVSPRNGKGTVRGRCANVAGDVCVVRLRLLVVAPKRKRTAGRSARSARRLIGVGNVRGTLKGGAAGQLRVKLNRKGKARLRKRGKRALAVRVRGTSSTAAGVALRFDGRLKILAKKARGKKARTRAGRR